MKLGWFFQTFKSDDQFARGYLNLAFNLWARIKEMPDVELVNIGSKNYRRNHWKKSSLDAVVEITPPHRFVPFEHAPTFSFSMWEAPALPKPFVEILSHADYHLVPSQFCRAVWERAGFQAGVVPLGVSRELLETNPERRLLLGKGTPRLRFLYVGSNDVRKGWPLIAPAFKAAFESRPDALPHVQLYIKTFGPGGKDGIEKPYGDDRLVLDYRKLEAKELASLYESAEVFVFPSFAEGFGLPPLEAMSSGCLAIAPRTGGMIDFIREDNAVVLPKTKVETLEYGVTWKEKVPTVDDLARCFRACFDLWGTPATERLRKKGVETARQLTWDRSARILYLTVRAVLQERERGVA